MSRPFLTGIIEGFYGRQWSWPLRRQYAAYLKSMGFNSYLYCPKGDAFLRKRWREDWPAVEQSELETLAETCREAGLYWGVGLSPYALYQDYSNENRSQLRDKVRRIDALGGSLLAILFDDMPGDCAALAERQAEIVQDVQAWSAASHIIICPTYYSFDAVLERFFGERPGLYWEDLGRLLPADVDIFWTGNAVCSASISCDDIAAVSERIGRPPVLWDNYPVNDGEQACRRLNLAPLAARDSGLAGQLRGHFCNPMNQGLLSRLPLEGLARLYDDRKESAQEYFEPDFLQRLALDRTRFQDPGLDGLDEAEQAELIKIYTAFADPAAAEVVAWLAGEYAFDPACLTG